MLTVNTASKFMVKAASHTTALGLGLLGAGAGGGLSSLASYLAARPPDETPEQRRQRILNSAMTGGAVGGAAGFGGAEAYDHSDFLQKMFGDAIKAAPNAKVVVVPTKLGPGLGDTTRDPGAQRLIDDNAMLRARAARAQIVGGTTVGGLLGGAAGAVSNAGAGGYPLTKGWRAARGGVGATLGAGAGLGMMELLNYFNGNK